MTPMATTTKLNDCCVVRTTFSPGDSSFHRTRPVSPVKVMDFRGGPGIGLPGIVSRAGRVVEKAARMRRVEDCWMRGSSNDGRRSEMASVGLYRAVIVRLLVFVVLRVKSDGARAERKWSFEVRETEARAKTSAFLNFGIHGWPTHCTAAVQQDWFLAPFPLLRARL